MMHGMVSMVLQDWDAWCHNIKIGTCPASNVAQHCAGLQEKARVKAERDAAEAKYKTALVDGRQEQVCYAGAESEAALHRLRWHMSSVSEPYKATTSRARSVALHETAQCTAAAGPVACQALEQPAQHACWHRSQVSHSSACCAGPQTGSHTTNLPSAAGE